MRVSGGPTGGVWFVVPRLRSPGRIPRRELRVVRYTIDTTDGPRTTTAHYGLGDGRSWVITMIASLHNGRRIARDLRRGGYTGDDLETCAGLMTLGCVPADADLNALAAAGFDAGWFRRHDAVWCIGNGGKVSLLWLLALLASVMRPASISKPARRVDDDEHATSARSLMLSLVVASSAPPLGWVAPVAA